MVSWRSNSRGQEPGEFPETRFLRNTVEISLAVMSPSAWHWQCLQLDIPKIPVKAIPTQISLLKARPHYSLDDLGHELLKLLDVQHPLLG